MSELSDRAITQSGMRKRVIRYKPRGSIRRCFTMRDEWLVLDGPAGTGKSRGALEKLHLMLTKYPKSRGLMCRKTRQSMTETCMDTFEREVLHPLDGVTFHTTDQRYDYPNGSSLIVAGLDKPSKIMSSQYDVAYVQEATEATLDDCEMISTRLRNGVIPYQQFLMDCNPDRPTHWINVASKTGRLTMLETTHRDNPVLWDEDKGDWTEKGLAYIARLDRLTGVRLLRLRHGLWAAAEGIVYDEWDRTLNMVDYFPPPEDWPVYWAVDFGYTHPFVWQKWVEDPDGRLYMVREIYHTRRLVEDHARQILALTEGDPKPRAIICDHDAEDRATLERYFGMLTVGAYKRISNGIQGVKARLPKAGDGKSRLFLMRDALVERDMSLIDEGKPTCTADEFECYSWPKERNAGYQLADEVPVDKDNHGMDALRYVVAFTDSLADDPQDFERLVVFDERVSISRW